MYYILIDGDNITIETFENHIKQLIQEQYGSDYKLNLYCQSNIMFKFRPLRSTNIIVSCSKTTNKNASDAKIIFDAGQLRGKNSDTKIIIVSNDKIFEEICDGEFIKLLGFVNPMKKYKLKKETLLSVLHTLIDNKDESDDIYLEDFKTYFKEQSTFCMKNYIEKNVPEISITSNDTLYFTT